MAGGLSQRMPRLSVAAFRMGILSISTLVIGMVWTLTLDGESGFSAVLEVAIVAAVVAAAGVVTGIVALARRALPKWMGIVGLSLSLIPLVAVLFYVGAYVSFALLSHDYLNLPTNG